MKMNLTTAKAPAPAANTAGNASGVATPAPAANPAPTSNQPAASTGAPAALPPPVQLAPSFAQMLNQANQGQAANTASDTASSSDDSSQPAKSSDDGSTPADGGSALPAMAAPMMALVMPLPISPPGQFLPDNTNTSGATADASQGTGAVTAAASAAAAAASLATATAVAATATATTTPVALNTPAAAGDTQAAVAPDTNTGLPATPPAPTAPVAAAPAAPSAPAVDSNANANAFASTNAAGAASAASNGNAQAANVVAAPAQPEVRSNAATPASVPAAAPAPSQTTATAQNYAHANDGNNSGNNGNNANGDNNASSNTAAANAPAAPSSGASKDDASAQTSRNAPAGNANVAGYTPPAPASNAGNTVTLAGTPQQWQQPLRDALGDRLQLQLQNNDNQATIRLEPQDMGSIDITIRHADGALQVNLSASNSEVLRQLTSIGDSVRQDLSQRQFSDVNVTVTATPRGAQSFANSDGGGRNQQGRQQDQGPGRALSDDEQAGATFAMQTERE